MKNSLYIKKTNSYGNAIFTNKNIKKGEIVFTIKGRIVDKSTIYTIPIAKDKYIDDEKLGKYLCHSCNPNCGIKDKTKVIAMKDIKKGEEITIDYAMIVYNYGDEMTEENKICKCKEINCRGKLGAYRELPKNLKKKYKGFISEYLLKISNE